MKEHPIIFNTEMVKAILDGRKIQTRRSVKKQSTTNEKPYLRPDGLYIYTVCNGVGVGNPFKCPYGKVGDILWVRETWKYGGTIHNTGIRYKADNKLIRYTSKQIGSCCIDGKWKPSIYMPKKYCRIKLEITDIRVERIREISGEDSIKEGIKKIEYAFDGHEFEGTNKKRFTYPMDAFADLWDSINKKRGYGWDVNPYVWVVEFKRRV